MYKKILVPIDLADPDLAKPAVATALMMTGPSDGTIRFVNVLPLTPVMLAEYVPPDFEAAVNADLIVMSSHRPQRPGMRTYFLGSNAGHVVRYAKCSVLVVRR